MLDQTFTVTLEGAAPLTVTPDARDLRRWEAATGKSWLGLEVPSITDMTRLMFFAASRSGSFSGSWDDFDNRCITFDTADTDPKASPTDPAPSDG